MKKTRLIKYKYFLVVLFLFFENSYVLAYEPSAFKEFPIPNTAVLFPRPGPQNKSLTSTVGFWGSQALPFFALPKLKIPVAVVLGAGIAGLMDALILKQNGFDVIVLEKRSVFNRMNFFSLYSEIVHILEKLNILEDITRKDFMAIIKNIDIYSFTENDKKKWVEYPEIPKVDPEFRFTSHNIKDLYSSPPKFLARIADLQNYLANIAVSRGIKIASNVRSKLLRSDSEQIFDVSVQEPQFGRFHTIKKPSLVVIAEGSQGEVLREIGGEYEVKKHSISHNDLMAFGSFEFTNEIKDSSTVVLKSYDKWNKTIKLKNITYASFHAGLKTLFLTILLGPEFDESPGALPAEHKAKRGKFNFSEDIFSLLSSEAKVLASLYPEVGQLKEVWSIQNPIKVEIKKAVKMHFGGNVVLSGDVAGTGSPIASLGGTLAMSAYPYALNELASYYRTSTFLSSLLGMNNFPTPDNLENYSENVNSFVDKWIDKSDWVKRNFLYQE